MRDWTIDVLRICSLGIVVLMHWTAERVTVDHGAVHTAAALHGIGFWIVTWVLQIMPVYFLCGGFANTHVWDRCKRESRSYGEYLGLRARKLCTPVVLLLVVAAPVLLVLRAVAPGVGAAAGDAVSRPLWFLAVYLVAVAVAPWAIERHDRAPALAPVLLLAASGTVDLVRLVGHDDRWNALNLLFVWLLCHQLGILHARGTLRRYGDPALGVLLIGMIALIAVLTTVGPYFPTVLGMADAPMSNLSPPTSVLSLLGLAQLLLLTMADRRLGPWQPTGRARAFIQRTNALAILIYLWHLPVLTALHGLALVSPKWLLPADEATWWLTRPLWFAVGGALLYAMLGPAVRWETMMARFPARTATAVVLPATLIAAVGIYLQWRQALSMDLVTLVGVTAVPLATLALTSPEPCEREVSL